MRPSNMLFAGLAVQSAIATAGALEPRHDSPSSVIVTPSPQCRDAASCVEPGRRAYGPQLIALNTLSAQQEAPSIAAVTAARTADQRIATTTMPTAPIWLNYRVVRARNEPILTGDACSTTLTSTTTGWEVARGENGKVTQSFNPTKVLLSTRCANGMYCADNYCMERVNSIGASGIVMALVFSLAIVVSMATILYFRLCERRQQAHLRVLADKAKAAEAAEAEVARKRHTLAMTSSSVHPNIIVNEEASHAHSGGNDEIYNTQNAYDPRQSFDAVAIHR